MTAPWIVSQLAAGEPITALAGMHPGCFELFAHEPIRTISDLKGKRFGIQVLGSSPHLFLAIMAAHVGLDPTEDIDWVAQPALATSLELFATREVDAFLGFPPEPQELRARNIGRVILNTATDKPWSQYFCCMVLRQPRLRPRPSGRHQALSCAPSSRQPTSAPPSRRAPRDVWSMAASRSDTTTRSRR